MVGGQGQSGPLQSVEVYDIAAKGSSLAINVYPEQVSSILVLFICTACSVNLLYPDDVMHAV